MSELEGELPFERVLQRYQLLINARLRSVLNSHQPPSLYKPIEYILESGGKRVRPVLLLLSCQALGGDVATSIDAAVAVELLHNFTLVHDDIMDRDATRRGQPTVHTRWNADVALLAGDALLGLAYQALLSADSKHLPRIGQVFTDGILELCEGQALDSDFEKRAEVSLAEYLLMIRKKTACLLGVASEIGALIGGGSDYEVTSLRNFGLNLGWAFQIQDDLLDITSDEKTLGKTFGSDVKRKKRTFLLIHALNHSDSAAKTRLSEILQKAVIENAHILQVKELFQQLGSLDAAHTAIEEYISEAHNCLGVLRHTPARENLAGLLAFLATRQA